VNTAVKEAKAIAEHIRLTVSEERAELPERITISMGGHHAEY